MTDLRVPGPLVSVDWLKAHLDHPKLVILDASMKPVGSATEAISPETRLQIPRTQVFDFDQRICDTASTLPHMMPSTETFETEVGLLGINNDSVIIVYDRMGVFSSPRARWMFKAMGHDEVAVLDGGLPEWIKAGYPTEPHASSGPANPGRFKAHLRPMAFCDADHVAKVIQNSEAAVLDARSEGRFKGVEPEPRPGLRSGHIPGSVNLPFIQVQRNGKMLSADDLASVLKSKTGAHDRLIFTCGSGVTACIDALAAELAGIPEDRISVYDGSWSEWGLPDSGRPVS